MFLSLALSEQNLEENGPAVQIQIPILFCFSKASQKAKHHFLIPTSLSLSLSLSLFNINAFFFILLLLLLLLPQHSMFSQTMTAFNSPFPFQLFILCLPLIGSVYDALLFWFNDTYFGVLILRFSFP
ncbi:hypothetical protein VNO77_42547 [Canavalia gladiata]|uniref:Uncharacterized protein n=1 Tax=Canavalia gladiata TaxID=3824 RepID=A0AAN9JT12_CANGL